MIEKTIALVRRGRFPKLGFDGHRTPRRPSNLLPLDSLLGHEKNALEALDAAVLSEDLTEVCDCFDAVIYGLERQIDFLIDGNDTHVQLNRKTSILRRVTAQLNHATLRLPEMTHELTEEKNPNRNLVVRLFVLCAVFTDRSRQEIVDTDTPLSAQDWFMAYPTAITARINIGVSYYHLSRILQTCDDTSQLSKQEQLNIFENNFDIMFYAICYGPMLIPENSDDLISLLEQHLSKARVFLSAPQPSISEDPMRFVVSKPHVLHVLTTVETVSQVLEQLDPHET